MNLFLKYGHISGIPYYFLASGMTVFPFAAMLFFDRFNDYYKTIFVIISVLIVVTIFFVKQDAKRGLYISKDEISYKSWFKTKRIVVNTIVAIKVTKALTGERFGPLYELKDINGNILYTMFFLKDIDDEILQCTSGDLIFEHEFRKHIICRCVYDRAAVEHLKSINSNIVYS